MMSAQGDSAGRTQASGDDVAFTWAAEIFSAAMQAARDGEPLVALSRVDQILARCPDHAMSVRLGISLARDNGEPDRLLRYRAIMLVLNPLDASNRVELVQMLSARSAHAASADLLKRLKPGALQAFGTVALQTPALDNAADAASPNDMRSLMPAAGQWEALPKVENTASIQAAIEKSEEASPRPDGQALATSANPVLLLRHAELLYGMKRWEEAYEFYGRVESDHPNAGRRRAATIFRARISRNCGNTQRAFDEFSAILSSEPDNLEACDFLVRQHWIEGRNEEALEVVRRFAAAAPDAPEATWLKAEAHNRLGQEELALSILQDGMEQHGNDMTYCCRYADLLVKVGALQEAYGVLEGAAAIEPASAPVFNRRIAAARNLGVGHAELIDLCDAYLRLEPQYADAMIQRANSLLRLGRRFEAYEQFVKGARLKPTTSGFWRSAAALAVSLNRSREAKALAAEARTHFDESQVADLCALASIYQSADEMDAALEFATAACKADPASSEAQAVAARLLVLAGRYGEAWPHLLEAASADNRAADVTALLAHVAAAFRYMRPGETDLVNMEPIAGLFPEVMFEKLAAEYREPAPQTYEPLVLHVTSSLAAGGAERQVAATVAAAIGGKRGYGVELVVDDLDPATRRDVFLPVVEAAGVPVHLLQQLRQAAGWRELLVEHPEYSSELRFIGALPTNLQRITLPIFTLFVQRRPRIVHLWQDMIAVAGCLAGLLAGVPRIVMGTRSTRPIEQQRFRRYFEDAYKAVLQCTGVVMINNSQNGAKDYEAWLGLAKDSVKVVHNGYDFNEMRSRLSAGSRVDVRGQLELPEDARVLGGVMRLSFEKRPDLWTRVAIDLALRDPRIHGVLIGEGPMRAELEAEIAQRNLAGRIRLVGQQSPIEPWMVAMDLLFLSSVTEGLPNVLIEAQSLGVPVATMRVGGAPETLIEGRTGIVADEGDTALIASTLAPLLLDHARCIDFGEEGKAWVEKAFSMEATLAKLDEIYAAGSTPLAAPLRAAKRRRSS